MFFQLLYAKDLKEKMCSFIEQKKKNNVSHLLFNINNEKQHKFTDKSQNNS